MSKITIFSITTSKNAHDTANILKIILHLFSIFLTKNQYPTRGVNLFADNAYNEKRVSKMFRKTSDFSVFLYFFLVTAVLVFFRVVCASAGDVGCKRAP
ncbi:MAG: hypothetical protein L6V93_15530 [Clostridiales bacterium]|nr:MAG: hypothetical protein L6V93_15530 [Clostridiales bacterium]